MTRVMPDPHKDIGLNILSQFHYGPEIQIATFETLADALQKPDRAMTVESCARVARAATVAASPTPNWTGFS